MTLMIKINQPNKLKSIPGESFIKTGEHKVVGRTKEQTKRQQAARRRQWAARKSLWRQAPGATDVWKGKSPNDGGDVTAH